MGEIGRLALHEGRVEGGGWKGAHLILIRLLLLQSGVINKVVRTREGAKTPPSLPGRKFWG